MDEQYPTLAFGMTFTHIPDHVRDDLGTLEREGAVYADHWIEEIGEFRHVRIEFTSDEQIEFSRRSWAYELFLRAEAPKWASDVPGIDPRIAKEADNYSLRGIDGTHIPPPYHCFAAFLGVKLEKLVCTRTDRRKVIELTGREKSLFEVRRAIDALKPTIRSFNSRGKNLKPWIVDCELDVRDLLYVMLRPTLFDISKEEPIPSKAGLYGYVDLYSAAVRLLIELKYISSCRSWKRIIKEVYADIQAYAAHPKCEDLFLVIVDTARDIPDPRRTEQELTGPQTIGGRNINVRAIICEP